jgi:hypothetical protein
VKFIVISIAMTETSTKQTEYTDCVGYFVKFLQVLAGIVPKLLHAFLSLLLSRHLVHSQANYR